MTFLCQEYGGEIREPGTGLLTPLSVPEHQTVSPAGVVLGPPDVVRDDLSSGPAPVRVSQSVAAQPDVERGETAWQCGVSQSTVITEISILTVLPAQQLLQAVQPLPGADLGQPPVPGVSAQGGRQTVSPVPGEAGVGGGQPEHHLLHHHHHVLSPPLHHTRGGAAAAGCCCCRGRRLRGRDRRESWRESWREGWRRDWRRRTVIRWRTGVPLYTGTVEAGVPGVRVLAVVVIPTVRHQRRQEVPGG